MGEIPVIYEDEDIIVIDKPSGLAVQGGERVSRSVDDILTRRLGAKAFLVHRLDKDTSGLLLVAKNREAAAFYSRAISDGSIRKTYIAVCSGRPPADSGTIDERLENRGRSLAAVTRYRRLASTSAFSLLELELGTGRMHQIRLHLAGIGCPILGDDKYGDFALNKRYRKDLKLKRLLLHAYRLTAAGTSFGGRAILTAVPPDHFSPYLAELDPERTICPA